MRVMSTRAALIVLLASAAILTTIGVQAATRDDEPITLPVAEGLELKEGEGREAVINNCLACHTLKPILTHDGFTPETWASEVEKMRTRYGADISDADAAVIVAYLQENYSDQAPPADAVLLYGLEGALATPRPSAAASAASPVASPGVVASGSPEAAPDQSPSD